MAEKRVAYYRRICDDRFDTFGGETVIWLARINERSQHRCLIIILGRPTLLYNQPTAEISGPRVLEPRSARPDNDAPLKPFLLNPHSPIRSVSFSTPTDKKNGAAITLEIFPRFLPLQKEEKEKKKPWPQKFSPKWPHPARYNIGYRRFYNGSYNGSFEI